MGYGPVQASVQELNVATATAQHNVGDKIIVEGVEYTYTQADDTITQYQAVSLDVAADANAKKVTPSSAVIGNLFGVAQIAVTDEYFFWCATRGKVTCLIDTNATAGLLLAPSATAGVLIAPNSDGSEVTHVRAVAMEAGAATNAAKRIYLF